jgi:TolB-like protein/DNA-binding SARP family transcriptional activator/predicted Zn-dependent protease
MAGRVTPVVPLQITLLNGFHVAAASGKSIEIAAKKTRALLAYLALPAGRQHTRDELADLLWSDREDKQARASLRQALGDLRRDFDAVGISPLILDHDKVAVDAAMVEVDVATLERCAASEGLDDLRRAATVYAGDLFHGFDVSDPSYAEWLRGERERLRGLAIHVLRLLLEREAGQAAISVGKRLLELDPLSEETHRTLMRRYAEAGEIGAALKQYEKCSDVLRRELTAAPSPETETLHRMIRDDPGILASLRPNRSPAAPRQEVPVGATQPSKPSIAILPFTNLSGDPEQQYFSDGITNDLITDLSRFSGLFVIASNSTFTYRGEGVEVRQVSRDLGIRYVVQGSIQRGGGRVRINAQLIDTTTGAHLWGKRYDREAASLFAIQDELVAAIVTELAVKLDLVERDRAKRKMPENLSAYELWLRSRDHLRARNKEDNATARALLEKAVELDPNGARYFSDLAMAHLHESWWGWSESQDRSLQTAEDLAHKGVALDDADYWTHWALADVLRAKSDFSGAQAAYERSYALNPNDADLLADFGRLHIYLGRADESIRRIEKAMRLNPLYPDWYLIALGLAYFFTGNYQTIIDLVHKARQANPGLLRLLAAAHIMLDQQDQADVARAEVMRLEPWFTIAILRKGLPFKDPALGEPFFAALRKAGLPE